MKRLLLLIIFFPYFAWSQPSTTALTVNRTTGSITAPVDAATFAAANGLGGSGAPASATFITQIPNATLTNEQALSVLSTGFMYSTTSTGVVTTYPNVPINLGGAMLTTLTGGGVTDNHDALQAAVTAAAVSGTNSVYLPTGNFLLASPVTIPPSVHVIGQNGGFLGTTITYSGGSGTTAFTCYAPAGGAQLLYGGGFENIRLIGNSSAAGGISVSDTTGFEISRCIISGFTNGYCIELVNTHQWTEDSRLLFNNTRDSEYHYKFSINGGTTSFANTRIFGAVAVLTGVNDRVIKADATANLYAGFFSIKTNIDIDPSVSVGTKSGLVELGASANIENGMFFLFQELQQDRPFYRFILGAGSYISAFGYVHFAPSTVMSGLLGNANYYDSLASTSVVYLGPGGEFLSGTGGASRIAAGQATTAQRAATSNTAAYPAAYLSHGTATINLRYVGASRVNSMTLRVSTNQFADVGASSSTVTVLDNQVFNNTQVFGTGTTRPFLKFTTAEDAILYVQIANAVGDGVITATGTMDSAINTGSSSDFGTMRPLVLLPDTSGLTVGSVVTLATQVMTTISDGAYNDLQTVMGNTTTGFLEKKTYIAGTGMTITNNPSNVTWASSATGTGNVVGPATSSNTAIAVYDGTTGALIKNTGIFIDGSNNMTGLNNLTISNLTISGGISGTIGVANGGTGRNSLTDNNIVIGNSTTAVNFLAPGTSGNVVTSNGTAWLSSPATGSAALTTNYVGYGNATNVLTGEAAFGYNPSTNIMTVGGLSLGAGGEVSTIGPLMDIDGVTPLNNIIQTVAAGTAYTLTTTSAALDFGTTDPTLTIANAGTYSIYVTVQTTLVSATTTTQSVTYKLRRTNNTAADLTGSVFGNPLPIATITSELGPTTTIGPIKYTTSATNDSITVFGAISASLGAGSATATDCTITAIRAY